MSTFGIITNCLVVFVLNSIHSADSVGVIVGPPPPPQGGFTYMWDKYWELFTVYPTPAPLKAGESYDKSWLIEAGKPGYEIANAAWNKHKGFTFFTNLIPPSTVAPVNKLPGSASTGEEDGDDGGFALILGASVGGSVFVLAILGIMLWRIIKMKKIRGQVDNSAHKSNHVPTFIINPGVPTGLPPVESSYHGALQHSRRWKGHDPKQNFMAVLPPPPPTHVPGEVMYPPQINPWLK